MADKEQLEVLGLKPSKAVLLFISLPLLCMDGAYKDQWIGHLGEAA